MAGLRSTLDAREMGGYLAAQLNNTFPDGRPVEEEALAAVVPEAMEKLEFCFSHIDNAYFFDGERPVFNHLHGDHYAMFLYVVSRAAHLARIGDGVAEKIFLLNKALHGIDAFYEVELPDIFLFVHPVGTVLGRATYGDHLIVYQRCGVGSNHDVHPELGAFLTLHPGSAVYGACRIGSNCTLAAESFVLDQDLDDDLVYFGGPGSWKTRPARGRNGIWRSPSGN